MSNLHNKTKSQSILGLGLLGLSLIALNGCATKGYVDDQVAASQQQTQTELQTLRTQTQSTHNKISELEQSNQHTRQQVNQLETKLERLSKDTLQELADVLNAHLNQKTGE